MNFNLKDNSITFRQLKKNDVKELLFLLQDLSEENKKFFHPHKFDEKTLIENLNSNDHYFIIKYDDKIIGYSFLRFFGYKIPSFGCCIRKGFENKGYGTLLTNLTLKRAKEFGYSKVILKSYKENIHAHRIYKKSGFKIIGETEDNKQYRMEVEF